MALTLENAASAGAAAGGSQRQKPFATRAVDRIEKIFPPRMLVRGWRCPTEDFILNRPYLSAIRAWPNSLAMVGWSRVSRTVPEEQQSAGRPDLSPTRQVAP